MYTMFHKQRWTQDRWSWICVLQALLLILTISASSVATMMLSFTLHASNVSNKGTDRGILILV